MERFEAKRRTLRADMTVNAKPEHIFPLLCPVREYEWIGDWECTMVWSESGFAEDNCIFQTDFPEQGGRETWVICRHDPNSCIEFVRSNENRVIRYSISLRPQGACTVLTWQQTHTGLTPLGNGLVEDLNEHEYAERMAANEALLDSFLQKTKP